jgi:16S rRNA G966 N2-methylase RsmD
VEKRRRNSTAAKALASATGLDALYGRSLPATRSGSLYGAFPYPTKISPEAIALFIAAHTKPGDTVFDGFAGSGTTGLAALLCENPPDALRQEAKRLGLNIQWGARNAVLYELSALGSFVGRTLTSPPDPGAFRKAAEEILTVAEQEHGWMYAAADANGKQGVLRYAIWSDLLECPKCGSDETMWDACVSRNPARIASEFTCPSCDYAAPLDEVKRPTARVSDDILGKRTQARARKLAWVYGSTGKKQWSRPASDDDLNTLRRIAREPIPSSVPCVEIPWGDLYRGGYHQGMTHLHHFYTRRNLIVFARLWEHAAGYKGDIRNALRFWLLSYNASHATIMTRVVAKSGLKDLVVTSAQPGVLYVSGLPVEKNLISGLRRKLSTIGKAFDIIRGRKGHVDVHQQSSLNVGLPDQSIDYVFTDPPFGGNIPYAEINFLNEAWLDRYTNRADEVIISNHQEKTLSDYQALLTASLSEACRILKNTGKATVVFHSATAEVWNALQASYSGAGFNVESAGVLDKTQGSFKQVTTLGAVRGDPVLLLRKQACYGRAVVSSVWKVAEQLMREASLTLDPAEQTAQRLYSRLVTHYLSRHQQVPLDAHSFYRWHAEQSLPEYPARV